MNANLQTFTFAMVIARTHKEVLCANALMAIRATLQCQMDAEVCNTIKMISTAYFVWRNRFLQLILFEETDFYSLFIQLSSISSKTMIYLHWGCKYLWRLKSTKLHLYFFFTLFWINASIIVVTLAARWIFPLYQNLYMLFVFSGLIDCLYLLL